MIIIPTISELFTSILADLEATYGDSIPLFGKNFLRALAAVQAAKLKIYYYAIAKTQKNIFVDTADPEASGGTLERFGRVKLGRNPFPAKAAQYAVDVTGTIGAEIPASTTFKSNDDSLSPGKLFVLDSAHILVATTDSITLRALEAGLDSKLVISDLLSATSPIANVDKTATVTAETVEPLSEEDIELYRQRALASYRLEAQGGAATDYRLWSFDAQGVQQTYPYARTGDANEIDLFVEATVADSIDGKGTPSSGILDDVEEVVEFDPDVTKPLNDRGRRPLGVFIVHFLPINVREVDIVIDSFVGLTPEIETLIFSALELEIDLIRPFIGGADILEEKNDILDLNKIVSIILNARPGSIFGTITLKIDSVPVSTFTFINGDIPNLDTVTYTP
jgi:uncharacterized phage protein gp47/JayE